VYQSQPSKRPNFLNSSNVHALLDFSFSLSRSFPFPFPLSTRPL
jgi:hypothetical protein